MIPHHTDHKCVLWEEGRRDGGRWHRCTIIHFSLYAIRYEISPSVWFTMTANARTHRDPQMQMRTPILRISWSRLFGRIRINVQEHPGITRQRNPRSDHIRTFSTRNSCAICTHTRCCSRRYRKRAYWTSTSHTQNCAGAILRSRSTGCGEYKRSECYSMMVNACFILFPFYWRAACGFSKAIVEVTVGLLFVVLSVPCAQSREEIKTENTTKLMEKNCR